MPAWMSIRIVKELWKTGGYRMNLVLIRPKIASAAFQSN
jgi:hypothetical protein